MGLHLIVQAKETMYSVNVRDHFMIAHSFRGEAFGPAQRLHGATYVVDVEFRRAALDADGMVVDIARATDVLRSVLGELNLRNLDDEPAFEGRNTTTEFAGGLASLRVRLHESHVAWAAYEGPMPALDRR